MTPPPIRATDPTRAHAVGSAGTPSTDLVGRVHHARRLADALLQQLLDDQAQCERRAVSTGEDPLKSITGASALDNAIGATREMIASIDHVAGRRGPALSPADSASPKPPARLVAAP